MNVEQAIARSISHNEIVTIPYSPAVEDELILACDAWTQAGDDIGEYWGVDDSGAEWRVHMVGDRTLHVGSRVRLLDHDGGRALAYYIRVRLVCGGERCDVACMVGAPESTWGTVRASGAGVRPVCTAWTADASDMDDVPAGWHDAVRDALVEASYRLYCAADRMAE